MIHTETAPESRVYAALPATPAVALPLPNRLQALLLDRDGVLNAERADYVRTPEQLALLPGALQALARAAAWGVPLIVITNQSCVGRGIVAPAMLAAIHARLSEQALAAGGRIDAFFVCPHHPDAGCGCRKPQPGLLLQAAGRFGLDLRQCLLVGDSATDMQAAAAAGCPAIWVGTGRQRPTAQLWAAERILPDLSAALDLLEAAGAVPSKTTPRVKEFD